MAKIDENSIAKLKALFQDNEKALGSNFSQLIDFFNNNKVTDNGDGTFSVGNTIINVNDIVQEPEVRSIISSQLKASTDLATKSDVTTAVSAATANKQDKIGYTPADDSKVVHSTVTQLNSTDMNTVRTAGFYQLSSGTNGMPNADAWTIYQAIPLTWQNGVQVAYETNNTILGMRSWNSNSRHITFTSWVQFADDSKVAHLSGANNFDTVPTVNNNPLLLASSLPSDPAFVGLKTQVDNQENDLNNSINDKLAQISSVPETFANLSALQAAYPNGKTGLFVTADTGHKYIWANNVWTDAGVYQSVGIADETVTPEKTTFIDNRLDFEIEIGTITQGVNDGNSLLSRLRTKNMLKNPHGITIVRKNENLMYGVIEYIDGVYNGVDHGWINVNETYIEPGKDVRFNIKKADNSPFTSDEIKNIHNDIEVRFSFRSADYYDLEDVKDNLLVNDNVTYEQFEYGSITGNTAGNGDTRRVHLKDFMQLNKNDKIVFNKDRTVFKYGVSVSHLDGTWNGIDYGWMNDEEFIVPQDSLVKLIISYADNRTISESDFNNVTDNAFTIATTLKNKVETNTRQLAANTRQLAAKEEITDKKEAINSISVEYGRLSGASYVFARIPKTTNTGKRLFPKLALTSSDGSLSGNKRSALHYAKDTDPIFTVNAGLFNVSTIEPVGQLIIDGVSLINTPMTSDNGAPINPDECYPLAIDANGDLTTYPHNTDTADMIAAGVKYAVTAWGKLVDNFEIATTDIENEIVHNGRYIRQSIGQYQNGDYCVCTVDMTRGPVTNEAGLYYKELAQIFVDKGVKFAFSLDGGGSAETVLGKRQLNPIYEGSEGRAVPTVITFEIDAI